MDYVIRKVRKEDIDDVTKVEASCFPEAEAALRESFEGRIESFPDSFFVAETKAGEMIGFINGCVTDESTIRDEMFEDCGFHDPTGAYQSIFGLDVMETYRKQGIGGELMRRMIAEAKAQGRQGVILTCKDKLIHYYETFGYRNLGLSASVHGKAVWYDMILALEAEQKR